MEMSNSGENDLVSFGWVQSRTNSHPENSIPGSEMHGALRPPQFPRD